jgi:YidC/Oxa1 family membrane protein insertase
MTEKKSQPGSSSSLLWGAAAFFAVIFLTNPFFEKLPSTKKTASKEISGKEKQSEREVPAALEKKPLQFTDKREVESTRSPMEKALSKPLNPPRKVELNKPTAVVLEDALRRFEFNSLGASLSHAVLKVNEQAGIRGAPIELLKIFNAKQLHFGFDFSPLKNFFLNHHWKILSRRERSVVFFLEHPSGLKVKKTFFLDENYLLKTKVSLEGLQNFSKGHLVFWGPCGMEKDPTAFSPVFNLSAVMWSHRENGSEAYKEVDFGDLESRYEEDAENPGKKRVFFDDRNLGIADLSLTWWGQRNKYCMAISKFPGKTARGFWEALVRDGQSAPQGIALGADVPWTGGSEKAEYEYFTYLGPRHKKTLEKLQPYFLQTFDGGLLGPIKSFLLVVLEFLYGIIHSYGLAIIILTLLVRMAIHPMTKRSQVKMQQYGEKMKQLQPKLEALKKKHGNDKQAFARDQMKLMREANVTGGMLGGCLPMLLQMPIFFSLYYMLREFIELRGATFLWIKDLSLPDRLFDIHIGFVDSFNLLPLLTLAVTIIQMKKSMARNKSNSPEQEAQQKIMLIFMPFMMLFFTYNFSSGLLLYWFTSALFGIFEAEMTRRTMDRMKKGLVKK